MSTHWYILGAGAIGCLWAKWLSPNATLLLSPESNLIKQFQNPEKINPIVFSFEYQQQSEEISLPCALPQSIKNIENLLICTKAHQTEAALKPLSLSSSARIVLLQNGMGNQRLLEKHFPQAKVFCASTTHGAFRKNSQHIVHAGLGETYIGSIPDSSCSVELEKLTTDLDNPFEKIKADPQMEKRLWMKLAINCAINPLTVIHQCQNGKLIEAEESRRQLKIICEELDSMLRAKSFLSSQESCYPVIVQVIRDTASNYSSMYQDFLNKRPSEIDFIQGFFCEEARKLHIKTPENLEVLNSIKKIEASY